MANLEEICRVLSSVVKLSDNDGRWLGSVVGPHHIVTCAHCLVTPDGQLAPMNSLEIQICGEDNPRSGSEIGIPIPHDDFEQTKDGRMHGFKNDVVVVPLRDPVPQAVVPLSIMTPSSEQQLRRDTLATVVHYAGGDHLVQRDVNFARIHTVEDTDFYHDRMFAVSTNSTKGDSGAPLLARKDGSSSLWYLIGLHSQSGKHSGAVLGLASSTRLSHQDIFSWIQDILNRTKQDLNAQHSECPGRGT